MSDDAKRSSMDWPPPPFVSSRVAQARRYWKYAVLLLVFLSAYWFVSRPHPHVATWQKVTKASTFKSRAASTHPLPGTPEALQFWIEVAEAISKGKPSFEEIRRVDDSVPWMTFDREKQDGQRPDNLNVTIEELDELKRIHNTAKTTFGHLAQKLPFIKGTRGVITTANNDALAIQTSSLWMLRASGSTLPVEVWFYDYDSWEDEVCKDIFPSLGARCMFMIDYLPKELPSPIVHPGDKFTFKTLTMMFSTFEQVLFLDCDAFPVQKPDSVFDTEPFNSTGFVLWPDYWANTASKHFYDIIGKPVPDLKEMAATESGEMIINKATHAAPILLANFYNYWGKEYWYRLWSQAAPGEGDKEGYLAAAMIYKLPWYQVNERPERLGYRCEDHRHPIGSAQSHPLDDFTYAANGIIRHDSGVQLSESIHPRILFIHANLPKADPYAILEWDIPELEWEDMLRCEAGKGKAHRLWGPRDLSIIKYGWDAEKALWAGMRWEACVHETGYKFWTIGTIFRPEEHIRHDLCEQMTQLWSELFPGETWTGKTPPLGRPERPWGGLGLPTE